MTTQIRHTPAKGPEVRSTPSHHKGPLRGILAATVVLHLCALAACGGPASRGGTAAEPVGGGPFPVTLAHSKGTATIPAKPRRVVVLGYTDAAVARALGAPIVAAVRFRQGPDGHNFPAVTPPLPPDIAALNLVKPNLERIAAAEPDLILATSAQPGYQDAYDKLAGIAPTVVSRTALLRDSPAELTRMIGAALGTPDAAEQLIRRSDELLDGFARQHPYLSRRTFAFGQTVPDGVEIVTGDDALSNRLFTRLGLSRPPRFAHPAGGGDPIGSLRLARENLTELDTADVAFIHFASAGARDDPLLRNLELTREQRLVALDPAQAYALLQPNPANTRYVLDTVGPALTGLRS